MSDKTGGSAFPVSASWTPSGGGYHSGADGMTLRDYFAAAALANMRVHENSDNPRYWKIIGDACYIAADALLAARAKAGA